MKKSLLFLFLFCAFYSQVSAQLLIEDFNYPLGSTLVSNGWVAHSGTGTEPINVGTGLSFNGYAGSGIGGAALIDANGEDVHKPFAPQTTGTVYAAFLVKTETTSKVGYFLHLGPEATTSSFVNRVWVNDGGTGIAMTNNSTAPTNYFTVVPGSTNLVVLSYDLTAKKSSIWVFPSMPASQPATPFYSEDYSFATVGSIALRQYVGPANVTVDGIRVGKTWAEVVTAGSSTPTVQSPVFSPPGGIITPPLNISLSTLTEGATIYYSTQSATGPWTQYTAPIPVTQTTTFYAYAEKEGMEDSPVSTVTYTVPVTVQVSNITELRAGKTDGTIYVLTGEAYLTHKTTERNAKYIQDATGAILIDDNEGIITTNYDRYDGISGIKGKLVVYAKMLQFVPVADPGPATSKDNQDKVVPKVVTIQQMTPELQAQLVTINSTTITDDTEGNFVAKHNYAIKDGTVDGVLRTAYNDLEYIGTAIPVEPRNITGVVLQYNDVMQLVPRLLSDFAALSANQVATPVFSPVGGNYETGIQVTLTTETPDATIFYSLQSEGGDWKTYTGPLALDTTATIWAYAAKANMDNSYVSHATYTFPKVVQVANIAELRKGATDGTIYKLTGEAILTFKSVDRNQKYIQDATGAILIDDSAKVLTQNYAVYDGITGITGTLSNFNNMLQFVPKEDAPAATSHGNTVTPKSVTIDQVTPELQGHLITVKGVKLYDIKDGTGVFQLKKDYPVVDGANDSLVLRTHYTDLPYLGSKLPAERQDVTGVLLQYRDVLQLIPRVASDFVNAPVTLVKLPTLIGKVYQRDNVVFYSFEKPVTGKMMLTNLAGQTLGTYNINEASGSVAVYVKPGLYILSIRSNDGFFSTKLVF